MQRSGAATRRFYAAFYQWTVRSANPTARRCAGTTLVPRRRQSAASTAYGGLQGPRATSSRQSAPAKEFVGSAELLRKEPVQSTEDKPTGSLDAWDHVIRGKEDKSVTVEISVPRWVLGVKDIAKRAELHEVQLSTPTLRGDSGDDELCAVLLSGDYSDVKSVWKNIHTTGFSKSQDAATAAAKDSPIHTEIEPITEDVEQSSTPNNHNGFVEKDFSLPEPFWQPIGKNGAMEYFQTQFGVHVELLDPVGQLQYVRLRGSERQMAQVDKLLERIRTWALAEVHEKNRHGASPGKQKEIQRNADLPSESLYLWQSVTRKLLEGQVEEEFCLPERIWSDMVKDGGVETFRARFAIDVEPLEVSEGGHRRSITLKGDVARVERARNYLENFRVSVPVLKADREYLRIYSATTGLLVMPEDSAQDSSPGLRDDTVKTDSAVTGKSYKRLTLNPTTEPKDVSQQARSTRGASQSQPLGQQPQRILGTARYGIPEHLRLELEASNHDILHRIKATSGLEAFSYLPMAHSKRHLKMVGSSEAREKAHVLLQESIDQAARRSGSAQPSAEELAISSEAFEGLPWAHVAWFRLPAGMPKLSQSERLTLGNMCGSKVTYERLGEPGTLKVNGDETGVEMVIAEIRRRVGKLRESDKTVGELEVVRTGTIADLGEDIPAKQATTQERSQKSLGELATSPARAAFTHFARIRIPHAPGFVRKFNRIATRVGSRYDCQFSPQRQINEAHGMLNVRGQEESIKSAIDEFQELLDEAHTSQGWPALTLEVVGEGLVDDAPSVEYSREPGFAKVVGTSDLVAKGAGSKEQTHARASAEDSATLKAESATLEPTHFAVLSLPCTSESINRVKRRKLVVARRNKCSFSPFFQANETEGLLVLKDAEKRIPDLVAELQRSFDEDHRSGAWPALKVDVVRTGPIEDLPPLESLVQPGFLKGLPKSGPDAKASGSKLQIQTRASTAESAAPEAESPRVEPTHFAWVKMPTADHGAILNRLPKRIRAHCNATMSDYRSIDETNGAFSITGSEEAVKLAIDEVEETLNRKRRDEGRPAAKLEIPQTGLIHERLPFSETFNIGPPVERSHFAYLRIPRNIGDGTPRRISAVVHAIIQTTGCVIDGFRAIDSSAGSMRVVGDEKSIRFAVEELQRLVVDECHKDSGRPAAKIEIIEMGSFENMPEPQTFLQSLREAAAMTSTSDVQGKPKDPAARTPHGLDDKKTEVKPTQPDNKQLSEDMRSALRHITQPVALVTAFMPQNDLPKGQHSHLKVALSRGVTVSSFCTVTLQPVPVVSFNIRVPSRTWDAIAATGYFRVHLLNASPEGATVAHAFTLPYDKPHEPFEHLDRCGATISRFTATKNPAKVPRIQWPEAVRADAVAKVLPEKCIEVGDHMIVVAEVTEVNFQNEDSSSGAGALAYGLRGYRQLGSEIKPMELKPVAQEPVDLKPAEPEVPVKAADSDANVAYGVAIEHVAVLYERFAADIDERDVDHMPATASPPDVARADSPQSEVTMSQSAIEDLIERKVTAALARQASSTVSVKASEKSSDTVESVPLQEESAPKNIEDLSPSSPILDQESLRQVLEEPEIEYSTKGLPSQTAADNPMLAEALNAVAGAYNDTPEHDSTSQSQPAPQEQTSTPEQPSISATYEDKPDSVLSAGKSAWGVAGSNPPTARKMSSWARMLTRYYSTSPSTPPPPPISKRILQTTISDYLCEAPTHSKRYANLIKTQRGAERLEATLQNPPKVLSEEEISAMEDQALNARRKVAKELALRNAGDLEAMLDKGRVDVVRAQWLESNLEHGQAVVLAEAKILRRELEEGRLGAQDFEAGKGKLTRDYEVLEAQLMRLRDFVDEDEVEGMQEGEGLEESGEMVRVEQERVEEEVEEKVRAEVEERMAREKFGAKDEDNRRGKNNLQRL